MDKIILKGMQFYGHHGVLPQEKELGQRFEVDAELGLDLSEAGSSDNLFLTVDYVKVFQMIKEKVTGSSYQLLEGLAEGIAAVILETFPVREVLVRVKKTAPPVPGQFQYVGVEIRRAKDRESKCPE